MDRVRLNNPWNSFGPISQTVRFEIRPATRKRELTWGISLQFEHAAWVMKIAETGLLYSTVSVPLFHLFVLVGTISICAFWVCRAQSKPLLIGGDAFPMDLDSFSLSGFLMFTTDGGDYIRTLSFASDDCDSARSDFRGHRPAKRPQMGSSGP